MHRTSLKRAAAGLTALAISGASLLVMASPASAAVLTPELDAQAQPTILSNDSNELAGTLRVTLPETSEPIPASGEIKITVNSNGKVVCGATGTNVGFAVPPTIPGAFGTIKDIATVDDNGTSDTDNITGTCDNEITIDLADEFAVGDTFDITNVRYKTGVGAPVGPVSVNVNAAAAAVAASNAIVARVDQPYAGSTRFDTAAKIAIDAYGKDTVETCVGSARVIIASGADANFPDALAASALAGKRKVPILLVNPTLPIPTETLNAIDKLGVENITVIGGGSAVSSEVFNALDARETRACGGGDEAGSDTINVNRIGGALRYDTSRLIAEQVGAGTFDNALLGGECTEAKTVIMVSGVNYPDALAAGSLASNGAAVAGCGTGQLPILLTAPGELSPATAEALTVLDAEQVLIVGGTAAVSQTTENAVLAHAAVDNVERIAGDIREETAAEIAEVLLDPQLGGFKADRAFVTTGRNFPDALAIGPIAGLNEAPVVLTSNSNTLGTDGSEILKDSPEERILHASLVGGTTVLTGSVKTAVGTAFTSRPST